MILRKSLLLVLYVLPHYVSPIALGLGLAGSSNLLIYSLTLLRTSLFPSRIHLFWRQ